MASLKELLQKTMLFTGSAVENPNIYDNNKLAPTAPIRCPRPKLPMDRAPALQPIWHWEHDPAHPARITNLKAFMRTMNGMEASVCTRIEVEKLTVTPFRGEDSVTLPLTPEYVLSKYMITEGRLADFKAGGSWWKLEAELDPSLLVVFGYELRAASGAPPAPLSLAKIEEMGPSFFPHPNVSNDDPDASNESPANSLLCGTVSATTGQTVKCFVARRWVIVAFGFTTCKERADFEPGGVLGAGRIYPHVMVTSNHDLWMAETSIAIERPAKAMKHDAEMQEQIGPIFMADTNENHSITTEAAGIVHLDVPPLPIWSNFFDYYNLEPSLNSPLVCVDTARATERIVANGIRRESVTPHAGIYEATSPFKKAPLQGDYDNLHLAPKMKFSKKGGGDVENIAMAPFCIHDCLHTHFRWGPIVPSMPKSALGFDGRKPYAKVGTPLVPSNQKVTITLTSPSAFKYDVTAHGPIAPSTWTVFNHHGSAYALAIASTVLLNGALQGVTRMAGLRREPYTNIAPIPVPAPPLPTPTIAPFPYATDFDPTSSFAAFYHRLQFTGTKNPDVWKPRINIIDLDLCRRT